MKKYIVLFLFVMIAIIPVYAFQPLTSYNDMQSRQETPYLSHNAECVSFDGLIWTRNYGMKEYFISPSIPDVTAYMSDLKSDGSSGHHQLIRVDLNPASRTALSEYSVRIPENYPFDHINVMLPLIYANQLNIPWESLPYDATAKPENSRPENRQVIYEQDFEEDLSNEYEIGGAEQPHILLRNVSWGILDCASYEGDQCLWCAADLYDNGWYTEPPDPCTSYVNWMWTYFMRAVTIDVTVAEELVFEWYSAYSVDPAGDGDWCRLWVIDYNTTEWMMVNEYTGTQPWIDFQFELEDFSNFAYYFEFESDDMEFLAGVYLDNISIYNMIPNLTVGENSTIEYPYNYTITEPHNLMIGYDVLNDSNVDIEDSFNVDLLLSSDNDYTTTDDNFPLDEVTINGVLSEESFYDELIVNLDTVVIPGIGSLPEGDYFVMFYIDNNDDIDEYDEEDNFAVTTGPISVGVPNLLPGAASSFTFPYIANTNQMQVISQILNDGTEPTSGPFEVIFLLSADNDYTTTEDNYNLDTNVVNDILNPGVSVSTTMIIDLDEEDIPADDYWIFVFIDAGNAIAESNEYDNIWVSDAEFDYLGAPYLIVDPQIFQFTFLGGIQTMNISSNADWTITNNNDWFSFDTLSGTGDAVLTLTCDQNTVPVARTGNFSAAGANEFIICSVSQEEGSNIMYGDVDNTLIVDAYDASLVLQYVVGIPTGIDPFPIVVADVDGDGVVAAYDAGLIMQFVVGLIDIFPVEEPARSNARD
ncbi:MAG: dockerin type I domain-containing protein [Candidatus Electryonea clarkiae]|nr:dockerin type I domain-containing protein [Candidatus Stygibacter australis]MDP8285410.1 dockerin type I domain-containing protein [Candidatus Electryonea clarkiae]